MLQHRHRHTDTSTSSFHSFKRFGSGLVSVWWYWAYWAIKENWKSTKERRKDATVMVQSISEQSSLTSTAELKCRSNYTVDVYAKWVSERELATYPVVACGVSLLYKTTRHIHQLKRDGEKKYQSVFEMSNDLQWCWLARRSKLKHDATQQNRLNQQKRSEVMCTHLPAAAAAAASASLTFFCFSTGKSIFL